jgi:hypothetical protein
MFAYSPWGKLPAIVIRSENPAADAECGGPGGEGTDNALRAHQSPAAGDSLNSSGPMADREPVSFARVHFLQEPARGPSKIFALSCVVSAHGEQQTTGVVGNVRKDLGEIRNVEC